PGSATTSGSTTMRGVVSSLDPGEAECMPTASRRWHAAGVLLGTLLVLLAIEPPTSLSSLQPAWGASQLTSCDYAALERQVAARETRGECKPCGQECAFLQILLLSRQITSTAGIAETDYRDRFPRQPAGISKSEASINKACQLALGTAADSDRSAKLV